jgi:hypothetical protein
MLVLVPGRPKRLIPSWAGRTDDLSLSHDAALTPRCLLMAQSRHAQCAGECPLLGAKRTLTNRWLSIAWGFEVEGVEPDARRYVDPPRPRQLR